MTTNSCVISYVMTNLDIRIEHILKLFWCHLGDTVNHIKESSAYSIVRLSTACQYILHICQNIVQKASQFLGCFSYLGKVKHGLYCLLAKCHRLLTELNCNTHFHLNKTYTCQHTKSKYKTRCSAVHSIIQRLALTTVYCLIILTVAGF